MSETDFKVVASLSLAAIAIGLLAAWLPMTGAPGETFVTVVLTATAWMLSVFAAFALGVAAQKAGWMDPD
jgi:hypothetical protein